MPICISCGNKQRFIHDKRDVSKEFPADIALKNGWVRFHQSQWYCPDCGIPIKKIQDVLNAKDTSLHALS